MELNFKDRHTAELFNHELNIDIDKTEDEKFFIDEMLSEEVEVSSSLDLNYLESLAKKSKEVETISEEQKSSKNETHSLSSEIFTTAQLNRIESKQNVILEILECMPTPTVEKVQMKDSSANDEEILKQNLELFNAKLIVLSTKAESKHIENLLLTLEEISEYLFSNAFNIFSRDKSPIKIAMKQIEVIGMGDATLNFHLTQTEKLLSDMDSFGKMQVFEQSYSFASLLLDKGLLLNAITLLNEATSIYIVESVKKFSKQIQQYTFLVGEKDIPALNSNVKEFFIKQYEQENSTKSKPYFPSHITVKEIDHEIIRKLRNIHKTWSHKGDSGLFQRYSYIIKRIRSIRNNVAHGNLEVDYREISNELKTLNDDFYYLAIKKNILKK